MITGAVLRRCNLKSEGKMEVKDQLVGSGNSVSWVAAAFIGR